MKVDNGDLRQKIKKNPSNFQKAVARQVKIITKKDQMYITKDLRTRIMKWYHQYLYHPGEDRMHKTLASTIYWEKMEDEIR